MRRQPEIPKDIFFGGGAAGQEETTRAPMRPARTPADEKVQVTIYMSAAAAKKLEAIRFRLLNEHDIKVSKSAIAEVAIEGLGEDIEGLANYFKTGERGPA